MIIMLKNTKHHGIHMDKNQTNNRYMSSSKLLFGLILIFLENRFLREHFDQLFFIYFAQMVFRKFFKSFYN